MQTKAATIHTRIAPDVKLHAEAILAQLGLSTSEAINLYMKHIILHQGIPFDVRIPNQITINAIEEHKNGNTKKFLNVDDLMNDLNA